MICSGYYIEISGNKDEKFNVIYKSEGKDVVIYLGKDNNIVSAYKIKDNIKYAFNNKLAEKVYGVIKNGIQGATAKNGTPVPFKYGAASMHYFKKHSIDYEVEKFNGEMVHIAISDKRFNLNLEFYEGDFKEAELNYVKIENESITNINVDDVPVRSLEEIALEKDISWLKDKKYYVVNDNATAEALFSQLEKYKGIIAVDYETTGLKINMFGQYGSKRRAELEKYNLEHPDSPIKTDSVVGIIFCVEEGVSYYFPVGHRKFDNLYSKRDEVCIKTIKNIKARYTVGDHRDDFSEYSVFIRNLPESDFTPDIILMERIRDILEKCNMLAHNGSFEYKVSLLYNIDLNLKEDTMLMHQLMYKFRSTTSNKGEPSNLKYLTKVEFNIEQLSLEDFFANYKEDNKGTVRNSKASTIDFSYMDYKGTKAYGPADGDFALALYKIYKKDLKTKYKDMEYIYNVEVIVAMAIGYMEFYGLRIDEEKIEQANTKSLNDMLLLEHRIRKIANYSSENEDKIYASLLEAKEANNLEKESSLLASLRAEIDASENVLNLNSPAQVSSLFYDILKYPCKDGDRSVGKKVIKSLTKEKDKDGSPKYPAVGLYREYKDLSSLVTKFFGKLPDFMYPGGFFFSSFGQISTATGRMSCLDEDTLVTTVGGVKKIKDIKVGDLVYCYDDNGDIRIKPVLNVIYKGYKDCIELKWRSSGSNKTGSLVCTPEHKIKTKEFGWIEAKDCLNKKVYHLHRSDEDRPKLFGTNSFYEQEQLVIKREYFGIQSYDDIIHHKDGNTRNNCIENLEIKERSAHSREHTNELVASGRIKYGHLIGAEHRVLKGKEHPCYIDLSAEELIDMIIEANGVLTKIDMDFNTFKKKCDEKGVDYDSVVKSILTGKRDISEDEFRNAYAVCSGITLRIAKYLGISRWRVDKLKSTFGLNKFNYNIDVCKYSSDFYSLNGDVHSLMEKYGISYKDCLNINKCLGLVFTGISDEDFTDSFFRNKGVINDIRKELGMTWYKAKSTIERLGLCYNHSIYSIGAVGKRNVYDLEIEGIHNFIANEMCVHNCSRPNSQQLPKSVTKIIVPRDNYIEIDADFSQIEYRTMTALAMEAHLIEQFRDPDSDFHTIMASVMYQVPYASVTPEMRSSAKSFNFGIPYGMGLKSLSILLFGDSTQEHVEKAKELYELYFKDQQNIRKFFDRAKETASVYKFNKTYFNRVRAYSFVDADGNFSEAKKAMALRQAGNFIIQGCLSSDTIIQTKEYGFTKIKDVAGCGERLHIWDGKDWTKGDVLYSGKKRKCIITLNDDRKIVCSPNHKFLVVYEDGNTEFIKCEHLIDSNKSAKPHRIVVNKEYAFKNSSVEPTVKGFVNKDIDSLYVKSVEITDEEIDMYDIYNTDRGYFVADGVITHNSSADIFKIAVARNFSFIRRNKLFGKILITNMVHDEMLFEVDCNCINVKKALAEIIKNMEFKLEGFPPLYVGAGVNMSWASAKGKMSEIHPVLANQFIDEAENLSIYSDKPVKNTDIQEYFNDRVYQFRVNKIIDYLKDENNHNKEISPIIGNLLSLQFDYGVNKEFDSKYTEENGYSKEEIEMHKKNIPLEQLKRFIADKKVDIDPNLFKGATIEIEKDKDVAYSDEDDLDVDEFENESNHIFALIEEDTSKYGISIQDLIKEFGLFVSVEMSICGIDLKKVSKSKKEDLYKMLEEHECNFDDEGSLQVVFLGANNNLIRTDVYVNNLTTVDVADRLHINTLIA
jgi:DNA-directed DNA polymerase